MFVDQKVVCRSVFWTQRQSFTPKQRYLAARGFLRLRRADTTCAQASWLEQVPIEQIQSRSARACIDALQRCPVHVPDMQRSVKTAFLRTSNQAEEPIVLMNGFDGSCLEFRDLLPLLDAAKAEAWAIDVAGWGFTDAGFAAQPNTPLGAAQRRAHLFAFWKDQVKRPMVLVGGSVGAATAVDFACEHPEAVSKLVIIDGQIYVEGLGPMSSLPRWLATLGVKVLRSKALRRSAGRQMYFDKSQATEEAMLIGRLHTWLPGWADSIAAYMQGGGYQLVSKLPQIRQPTLIMWGRNDQIINPAVAPKFAEVIPDCRLVYVEECGHCAHLEQPQETARILLEFAGEGATQRQDANSTVASLVPQETL